MRKNAVKRLLLVIKYVPDGYKTQEIYDKVILENGVALMFVSNCYKNQQICNKAVDGYDHVLEFMKITSNSIQSRQKTKKAQNDKKLDFPKLNGRKSRLV